MRFGCVAVVVTAVLPFTLTGEALAQQAPQYPNMSFFITSTSGPKGADFGGIEGADKHCQALATRAGAGAKTWRAYLSVQALNGAKAVNARDRVGKGPWVNAIGVQVAANVDDLHSVNNKIDNDTGLTETGRRVPGAGFIGNMHDVLTGSTAEGQAPPPDKDMTCGNWTKSGEGSAMVGHADRKGLRWDVGSISWNAAHPSRGCSATALQSSGGAGLLYCFAAN
ncbi:MAG: hypothetical protein AB7S93_25355 [Xanthobacteraceae bacterium]